MASPSKNVLLSADLQSVSVIVTTAVGLTMLAAGSLLERTSANISSSSSTASSMIETLNISLALTALPLLKAIVVETASKSLPAVK